MGQDAIDALDDLLLPEDDGSTGVDMGNAKEVEAFKEQVTKLEKENKGLLKGVQEERRKRQEMRGRLDQITNTVNTILDQRQTVIQSEQETDAARIKGIPVEFTEEGDAFVPSEGLQQLTSKYEDEIAALKEELHSNQATSSAEREYQQAVAALVGEKPEYSPAYQKYQAARKWVEDTVVDWTARNGINQAINSGQALDHVFDAELSEEFSERFPNVDLAAVVTAQDSTWHFRKMLDTVAGALPELQEPPKDGRFQRVLNKPSSLGKTANAKGGEPDLAEKASSLSSLDFLSLTDEQVAALERSLLREEQTDGIQF